MSNSSQEILIKYKNNKEDKIKIFGDTFVKNNKDKCKIYYNDVEQELVSYINNKNNNNDMIEIILRIYKSDFRNKIMPHFFCPFLG